MIKIAESIVDCIGNTPLLNAKRFCEKHQLPTLLYTKLEGLNAAGSIKDRAAMYMILEAEKSGQLQPGSVIVEPTSGNTGIALAAIGVSRGYRVILTMPETMSIERRNLLKAYGAELVLTDGSLGMDGAIAEATRLASQIPNSFIAGQFENPANAQAHFETTGPEILKATEGKIDYLVAGVGTGGTITGTGRFLKSKLPHLKVIAVEPTGSPFLSQKKKGSHNLQGIGAGFCPELLDTSVYDEIVCIKEDEAYECGKSFAQTEGILVGISSGAALAAARLLSRRIENKGKSIVAILPDNGDKYFSTPLFD